MPVIVPLAGRPLTLNLTLSCTLGSLLAGLTRILVHVLNLSHYNTLYNGPIG